MQDKTSSVLLFLLATALVGAVCCLLAAVSVGADNRAYEMVSPAYKGGYDVGNLIAIPKAGHGEGERAAFFSLGVFVGSPGGVSSAGYMASRGENGWTTVSLTPPASLSPEVTYHDLSTTLETSLAFTLEPAPNKAIARVEGKTNEFLLHYTALPNSEEFWSVLGMPLSEPKPFVVNYLGASDDLCHVLFTSGQPFLTGVTGDQLYDLTRECGDESSSSESPLSLVAANNKDELFSSSCFAELGGGEFAGLENMFNAIADHGHSIFFTANVDPAKNSCLAPDRRQIFARLGGAKTIEVSRPMGACGTEGEVPCPEAVLRARSDFMGANEAGTTVFFTTTESLTADDVDTANDLYMATIGCPDESGECETAEKVVTSLVRVSQAHAGNEVADVQGLARVAPNGERVYFVAHGALTTAPNMEGRSATRGADNLYVYDGKSGETLFVGDICSDSNRSGIIEEFRCPSDLNTNTNDSGLWLLPTEGQWQTAGEGGQFLVFTTYAQLTADDTDSARDVYRYDAVTGVLSRVSIGEDGHHSNGNDSHFDANILFGRHGGLVYWQYEMDKRTMTEDGSQVVFTTAEPLSGAAINGVSNVYEWQQNASGGLVSMVSSGDADSADREPVISGSGRDVFFLTTQGLSPDDADEVADLYDARVGGGFPPSPLSREPCVGEACQGALSPPLPLLVPGTVSQHPEKVASVSTKAQPKRTKRRVKRKGTVRRKRSHLKAHHATPVKNGKR